MKLRFRERKDLNEETEPGLNLRIQHIYFKQILGSSFQTLQTRAEFWEI